MRLLRNNVSILSLLLILLLTTGCDRSSPSQVVGILEWDRVELTAEVGEPIVEVLVREGELIEADQILLRQDDRRVQAQRDESDATRAQAVARLAELKRGSRSEDIEEARLRLRGLKSEAVTADAELGRIRTLVQKKLSTPEALDKVRGHRDQAFAERDVAATELAKLLAGTTVEELEQAEAALAQTQARLRGLDVTLERLTLRAPRDGRIDTLPFKLGDHPQAGAVLAVVLAGGAPYARIYVPEPLLAGISQGSKARVFLDGVEEPFQGQVRMISHDAVFTPYYSLTEHDRSRLSYLAEVQLDGKGVIKLPAGVPLQVEFDSAKNQGR